MKRLVKKANQILYHGTKFDNARQIIQSGKLSPVGDTKNYQNQTLQQGAVFLTDSLIDAIQYSEVTSNPTQKEDLGVVFFVEVSVEDEQHLKPGDDVLNPEQKYDLLKEMGLVSPDQPFSSHDVEYLSQKYNKEIADYIHSNFNWQESLDIASEVAYHNDITLNKVFQMRVYWNTSDYFDSEVIDLSTLEELGDSILEKLKGE